MLASSATSMFFDGSAELDGFFTMDTSAGDDTLIGGAQADIISGGSSFVSAGNDTVRGNGGSDTFLFADDLNAGDRVNGGDGTDRLILMGDYSGGVTLANGTLSSIELLDLDVGAGGFTYSLTFADGNLASGETLIVTSGGAAHVALNGAAETSGHFSFAGGSGDDELAGGGGGDTLQGGGGADFMDGGAGADGFAYPSSAHSTGIAFDTIAHFDASEDFVLLSPTISGVDANVTHGILNTATFDADLAGRINAGRLAANHAVLYKPDGGDFAGFQFLIVDTNATPGYQAGDLVIHLSDPSHLGNLGVEDFSAI